MSVTFDILIKDAKIVDGTGSPAFKGSVGIKGEKIKEVGDFKGESAQEIDGSELIVSPGFVDMHHHGDLTLLQHPDAESAIMQGVTTFVGGNCGASMAPLNGFMPFGISSASIAGSWWQEVEPHSYGPPNFIPIDKYKQALEKNLGYEINWKTFGEFLEVVEKGGISINYVPLIGHNTVRIAVMGENFTRRALPDEIRRMKKHLEEGMESGAFGLGTGFDGGPGDFSSTEEVIELAKAVRRKGGIYASHTRNSDRNYPSTDPKEWGYGICHFISPDEMPAARYYGYLEAVEVARQAEISTQIAHLQCAYDIYHNFTEELQEAAANATLDIIDQAQAEGLNVSFDVIPDADVHGTLMSQPSLIGIFNKWLIRCGSKEQFLKNLKIRGFRNELRKEILSGRFKVLMILPRTDYGWIDRVVIMICTNKKCEGKTLREIARMRQTDPFDALFDLLIEDPDIKFNCRDPRWSEIIMNKFLKHPAAMIGSDLKFTSFTGSKLQGGGGIAAGAPGLATYASLPRYIRKYVREGSVLTLEEAVKKATSMPAQKLGLKDRGVIKPGSFADIVIFDFEKIRDKGTWTNPRVRPEGINWVMVNGKIVYEKMAHTGVKSGKVLRRA